ncbi:hypothetical protein SBF1_50005 [Candidatus Desulfosporosinus infrequens]|uniref:Uncharacterized protein n=1 Tax=Candidatus Desulfosporosinus infrequens TaxID=2043169 RepID=A0A2U3LGP8_9FIRM|nr:hypothetical protein SBF1_50005 [Candidatus Desulfosporosinus infrequens]
MADNVVGNIVARVGADSSQLQTTLKGAQQSILTFKNEALVGLKGIAIPKMNTDSLVASIAAGQRTIADFTMQSGENLQEFQQRVRQTFADAGVDIGVYEKVLQNASDVHVEFAKGAVKSFTASADAAEAYTSATMTKFNNLKTTLSEAFAVIGDSSTGMAMKLSAAGDIINTALPELFALGLAVMFIDKIYNAGKAITNYAATTQDAQRQFSAAMGSMGDDAEVFTKKLSDSYGVDEQTLKGMMGKEYMNASMQGFDPKQAEDMSEHITQLSYDLGKLRGVDPSEVFQSLQMGMEGQTRGLKSLGIEITATDLKNRALSEGVIKQGQTMTDAQTALMAYQAIMAKTGDATGYYGTQADTLSNRQAKLNADWEQMKRNLSDALIPALTELEKVGADVGEVFITIGDDLAVAIRYITAFVGDVRTVFEDLVSGDFSNIGQQWAANWSNAFSNTGTAADGAAKSTDGLGTSTDGLNDKQKALGKTLNANVMSFDQLHNITKDTGSGNSSGGAGGSGGTPTPPVVPSGLANSLSGLGNDKNKGLVIPVMFGPMPPPPTPPTSAPFMIPCHIQDQTEPVFSQIQDKVRSFAPSLVNVDVALTDDISSALDAIGNKVSDWKADLIADMSAVEKSISNWESSAASAFGQVGEVISGWETAAEKEFSAINNSISAWETGAVKAFESVGNSISGWEGAASLALGAFAATLEKDFNSGFDSAAQAIHSWETSATSDFSTFANSASSAMSLFGTEFQNAWNATLGATESMVSTWAVKVEQSFSSAVSSAMSSIASLASAAGQTISNVGTGIGNWASNNKGVLAAAGLAGLTVATGGTDLIAGGIAAAGTALAGVGASIASSAIPALASGGVVTAPQLAMIGEAGPEAVIPLGQLGSIISSNSNPSTSGSGGNSGQSQMMQVNVSIDGRTFARIIRPYTVNENDRISTNQGYDSSFNYPK